MCGMVLYGMVGMLLHGRYGMVLCGMYGIGIVWCGMVCGRYGVVWIGRHGMVSEAGGGREKERMFWENKNPTQDVGNK